MDLCSSSSEHHGTQWKRRRGIKNSFGWRRRSTAGDGNIAEQRKAYTDDDNNDKNTHDAHTVPCGRGAGHGAGGDVGWSGGHCAISIVSVMVFKHEISIFICWKIAGKNATLLQFVFVFSIATAAAAAVVMTTAAATVLLCTNHTYFNLYTTFFSLWHFLISFLFLSFVWSSLRSTVSFRCLSLSLCVCTLFIQVVLVLVWRVCIIIRSVMRTIVK